MAKRIERRLLFVIVVSAAIVLTTGLIALAQNFGPSGCCRYADSSNHTWLDSCGPSCSGTAWRSAHIHGMNALYSPTDVFGSEVSYRYNSNLTWPYVDVSWWIENIFPNSGLAGCNKVVVGDNTRCDHWHVRYHNPTSGSYTFQRHIACQEVGHTVGLDHSGESNSCMNNSATGAIWLSNTHDVGHINGRY